MHLSAIAAARHVDGSVVGEHSAVIDWFTTDSRRAGPGSGFVALHGERDGHDFVTDAFRAGARIALVEHDRFSATLPEGCALVVVTDTARALTRLALVARAELSPRHVIGITGSTGKTSTKDVVSAVVATRTRVHASPESFNNEIGLPLTLLSAPSDVEVLVVEMGARFAGNITELCEIARPNIGIVTNVGTAHSEHLGGREGVRATKGELVAALPSDGTAMLDADDDATTELAARTSAPVRLIGSGPGVDVRIEHVDVDAELRPQVRFGTAIGPIEARLGLRGAHQARNAAFAVAVGIEVGLDAPAIVAGLESARGSSLRMQLERTPSGARILNDTYNANPTSMRAALGALVALDVAGRYIAVLGDMRELGVESRSEHAALGEVAADLGVDVVVGVGEGGARVVESLPVDVVGIHVRDARSALGALEGLITRDDAVLLKASRAVGLDEVAATLVGRDPAPNDVESPA